MRGYYKKVPENIKKTANIKKGRCSCAAENPAAKWQSAENGGGGKSVIYSSMVTALLHGHALFGEGFAWE